MLFTRAKILLFWLHQPELPGGSRGQGDTQATADRSSFTNETEFGTTLRSLSSSFMHLLTFFACTPLPSTAVQYCMGGPYTSVRTRRRRSIPQSFSYCTKMNPSRQEKCSWSRICFCHLALKLHFPTFFPGIWHQCSQSFSHLMSKNLLGEEKKWCEEEEAKEVVASIGKLFWKAL